MIRDASYLFNVYVDRSLWQPFATSASNLCPKYMLLFSLLFYEFNYITYLTLKLKLSTRNQLAFNHKKKKSPKKITHSVPLTSTFLYSYK
jgi:hypothetical protein